MAVIEHQSTPIEEVHQLLVKIKMASFQVRQAPEAAAVAESKETTTGRTTSIKNQNEELLHTFPQQDGALKRKQQDSSNEKDLPKKKVVQKKYSYKCSADGCTNQSRKGGVCVRHGAKLKLCSSEACTYLAREGGVCIRHGTKNRKICCHEGCTKKAQQGGVCMTHGAKVERKRCSSEGCTNFVRRGGKCTRHGPKVERKRCSSEGCTNKVQRKGVCWRHGGKRKYICSSEGCVN